MELGKLILRARRRRGITQLDLAKQIGISPSAVSQWESGDTIPAMRYREGIARILDIPIEKLLPELQGSEPPSLDNPKILALVQLAQKLPPPLLEALLVQAAAVAEAAETLGRAKPPGRKGS